MKKTLLLRAITGFIPAIFCMLLLSCENKEYEISRENLNQEITVFQDGIVLPLGSTSQIKVEDILNLLDPETADYFKVNSSGAYSVGISGDSNLSDNLDFMKNAVDMEAISIEETLPFPFMNIGSQIVGSVEIKEHTVPINSKFAFEGMEMGDLPEDLVSVGEIQLDQVYLYMTLRIAEFAEFISSSDVSVDMKMSLPSIVRVEDERMVDGMLAIQGRLNQKGEITLDPVKVTSLDLAGIDIKSENPFEGMDVVLSGDILFKGGTANLGVLGSLTPSLQVDGTIMTAGTKDRIRFSKVTGKIDYQIYPMTIIMDMSELMSSLNSENLQTTLDVNRFGLRLDLESNFKIPVDAMISVTPYKGETAGTPVAFKNPIKLSCPEVSGESVFTRLWLSNTTEGKSEDCMFVELDLVSVLKQMPDRVDFTITAWTDPEEDSELVPSVQYVLKADYEAQLPIEFGKDFSMEFTQSIGDLPAELGAIFEAGSLALGGKITNSLPLQLEMSLSLLDSNGELIPLAEDAGKQVIKSCGADGTPVKSDVNLMLKVNPGADILDISSLELKFNVTSKESAGVPVTKDSFVQAVLYALVPEGITIDLDQYMEVEEK